MNNNTRDSVLLFSLNKMNLAVSLWIKINAKYLWIKIVWFSESSKLNMI